MFVNAVTICECANSPLFKAIGKSYVATFAMRILTFTGNKNIDFVCCNSIPKIQILECIWEKTFAFKILQGNLGCRLFDERKDKNILIYRLEVDDISIIFYKPK